MSSSKVINFMGQRKLASTVSILLILISIGSLGYQGLNFGLDFSGGTLLELKYTKPANVESIREDLGELGLSSAQVVYFGAETDIMIRVRDRLVEELDLPAGEASRVSEIVKRLETSASDTIILKRVEFVGPQVGEELREQGGLGLLVALLVVMIYVAIRFQYKFSIGAVAALFHDVIITLGLFSLFQWEFDLTVLAALLALIGYSLNDTIVVFDRIRENFTSSRIDTPEQTVNLSLTQTLSRTIVTSLTTLIVLMVLYFFGGEMINNFSLGLIIGVAIGTYSSIFVASNLVVALNVTAMDLASTPDVEGDELQDEVPY